VSGEWGKDAVCDGYEEFCIPFLGPINTLLTMLLKPRCSGVRRIPWVRYNCKKCGARVDDCTYCVVTTIEKNGYYKSFSEWENDLDNESIYPKGSAAKGLLACNDAEPIVKKLTNQLSCPC